MTSAVVALRSASGRLAGVSGRAVLVDAALGEGVFAVMAAAGFGVATFVNARSGVAAGVGDGVTFGSTAGVGSGEGAAAGVGSAAAMGAGPGAGV